MTKTEAKKLAETITTEEILELREAVKQGITNWKERARVNKLMTKGLAFNILLANLNADTKLHFLAKRNILLEFGDFLPGRLKPIKKRKVHLPAPVHQEPKF